MSRGGRLRVGIDNVSPGESTERGAPGGMRRYVQSLLLELPAVSQLDVCLFTPDWNDGFNLVPGRSTIVRLPHVPRSRPRRVVYQQWRLPGLVARESLDVFLATATVAPLRLQAPTVLVVQFLQFYAFPEAYGRLRTAYLTRLLPASVRRAARVIVFTEFQRRELLAHVPCDPSRIAVVPHGIESEMFAAAAPANELSWVRGIARGRPILLYVSATYRYKNHLRLIEAFAAAKRRHGLPHVLLLVGAEESVPLAALVAHASALGVGDDVVVTGQVPSVVAAYQAADAFVFPSLYETFGFPVLEAMAAGCPVVASNTGATAELCGDAAVLADATDPDAFADAIGGLVQDGSRRAACIARGRVRAAAFTWQRTAELTAAVLREAAETR